MTGSTVLDPHRSPDCRVCVRAQYMGMALNFVKSDGEHEWAAGILVEPAPGGGACIVASDGTTLVAWHDAVGIATKATWIRVPTAVGRAFSMPAKERQANLGRWFMVNPTHDKHWLASVRKGPLFKTGTPPNASRSYGRVSADEIHVSEIIERVDTAYPSWRNAFPTVFSREDSLAVPSLLLEKFGQVRPDGVDNPGITFSGIGPKQVLVTVSEFDEFVGLAFRRPTNSHIPDWIRPLRTISGGGPT